MQETRAPVQRVQRARVQRARCSRRWHGRGGVRAQGFGGGMRQGKIKDDGAERCGCRVVLGVGKGVGNAYLGASVRRSECQY